MGTLVTWVEWYSEFDWRRKRRADYLRYLERQCTKITGAQVLVIKVVAVPVMVREFIQYSKTVYMIILRNLTEDSAAYTCIEEKMPQQNGRIYFLTLKSRRNNAAADDVLSNGTKVTMKICVYNNERDMCLENRKTEKGHQFFK